MSPLSNPTLVSTTIFVEWERTTYVKNTIIRHVHVLRYLR